MSAMEVLFIMTIGEKIRVLRENREWTQAAVAEQLHVSADTVQKWEVEKNTPPTAEVKRLCELFGVSADLLLDDAISVADYIELEKLPGLFCSGHEEGDHTIYDADLRNGAKLHRFDNPAGCSYSAIYAYGKEVYSCEHAHEPQMIKYWNETE